MEHQEGIKETFHIFHIELESKSNNKDFYEVGSLTFWM